MKTKIITLLACVALIQSCKKKDAETPTPTPTPNPSGSTCYIQKVSLGLEPDSFIDIVINNYNSNFQLTSYQTNNFFTDQTEYSNITYSDNSVTTQTYNSDNVLISTVVEQLNNSGYTTSSISAGIDSVYGGSSPIAQNVYDTASYSYDANGFLVQETHRGRTVEIISGDVKFVYDTTNFVIQNENIVSVSNKRVSRYIYNGAPAINSQTSSADYTYSTILNKSGQVASSNSSTVFFDTDHTNGRNSKYLIATGQSFGNTETYTYVLNSEGYVTLQEGGFSPLAFEYTCH